MEDFKLWSEIHKVLDVKDMAFDMLVLNLQMKDRLINCALPITVSFLQKEHLKERLNFMVSSLIDALFDDREIHGEQLLKMGFE
jgi:CRISPR/Cas system CMR-associated protein Cmr1 (group 7 of RAMP superfamily)